MQVSAHQEHDTHTLSSPQKYPKTTWNRLKCVPGLNGRKIHYSRKQSNLTSVIFQSDLWTWQERRQQSQTNRYTDISMEKERMRTLKKNIQSTMANVHHNPKYQYLALDMVWWILKRKLWKADEHAVRMAHDVRRGGCERKRKKDWAGVYFV